MCNFFLPPSVYEWVNSIPHYYPHTQHIFAWNLLTLLYLSPLLHFKFPKEIHFVLTNTLESHEGEWQREKEDGGEIETSAKGKGF